MADTALSPEDDRKKNVEIKITIKIKKPVCMIYLECQAGGFKRWFFTVTSLASHLCPRAR